jgi:hypothetical protein
MTPDPNALMAASGSDALLDKQALQRRSKKAALTAQATAAAACLNTLITGHLHTPKAGAHRRRHLPDGMMSIGWDQQAETVAAHIEFVPRPYETVPAGSVEKLELRRGERVDT